MSSSSNNEDTLPSEVDSATASALLKIRSEMAARGIDHRTDSNAFPLLERINLALATDPRRQALDFNQKVKQLSPLNVSRQHELGANFLSANNNDLMWQGDVSALAQLLQHHQQQNIHQQASLSTLQLAALQAASANSVTSNLSNRSTGDLFHAGSLVNCASLTSQPLRVLTPLQETSRVLQQVDQLLGPSPAPPSLATLGTNGDEVVYTRGGDDCTSMVRMDESVRKEKVEAALRSKPQRGRKRENLSELERLELTRTRNREHAKSTRIRKKQRYEELLEHEKLSLEFKEREELEEKRRGCILNFVEIRNQMLPGQNEQSNARDYDCSRQWTDVIDSIDDFCYEDNVSRSFELTSIDRLKDFDRMLSEEVMRRYGDTAVSRLAFELKGGRESVALDMTRSGFAMVDLIMRATCTNTKSIPLLSVVMRFEFAKDSDKLSSLSWYTLNDDIFPNALHGGDHLKKQSSQPSLVSLDQTASASDTASNMSAYEESRNLDGDESCSRKQEV